jgi:hypothetical protein
MSELIEEFNSKRKERITILEEEFEGKKAEVDREVIIAMWTKHSRSVKTLAELSKLAESQPFKKFQDELPVSLSGGARSSSKTPGSGERKKRLTKEEMQAATEAAR